MYSFSLFVEFLTYYLTRLVFVLFAGLTLVTALVLTEAGILDGQPVLRILLSALPWLPFLMLHEFAFFGVKAGFPPQPSDFDEANNLEGIWWLIVVGGSLTAMFAERFVREHVVSDDPDEGKT